VNFFTSFTHTCVSSAAFSTKLRAAAAAAGGICVPKLIEPLHSTGGLQAAYLGAVLYCTVVNMNPPGGGIGALLSWFSAAAWCVSGSNAWGYVQAT
jgi:hypothetical protein